MPRQRIYVETTIPSAYFTSRSSPDMIARGEWTRRWWREAAASCELVSSAVVLRELRSGTSEHVSARLALIARLPLLDATPEVERASAIYIQRKLMPGGPSADALHLALASHYHCDVLATWNYRHLANANKIQHIRKVNAQLGLPVPLITTPRDLLEETYDRL